MEGFTLIDAGTAFILVVSGLLAYSRGFVREVLSIAGWIAAAIAAFIFAPQVEPLIKEIPVVRDIIGTNCELAILASFGLVFVAALIVVSIFTPLISGIIQNSALGPLDQGMGFLFGVARGALLIVVGLIIYDQLLAGGEGVAMVEDSKTVEILAQSQAQLAAALPEDGFEWVAERYAQLTAPCTGEGIETGETPPEATEDAPAVNQ
ncbi:MAG: CvpA family protein [Pseudomonadota bacterium]